MADKGTGFSNFRRSPVGRAWRYLLDPDVNSWAGTLDPVQPAAPASVGNYLDPREYRASQMLTADPVARATGVVPPVTAASPVRRQTGGAVDTLRSVNPLIPVGGVYSNTGNPGSWSSLAASGQPRAPVASSQPQSPSSQSYQQQQQPVRNAFTMGAPADDSNARLKAQEAIKRFNIAEESYKSNKTPEAEAAYREAQADTERWSKWAAMPSNTRKQVLMAGERAANAAQGRDNFATLRNEMDTPGAAELLAYAAKVNAGQIDASGNPISKYGSGQVVGYVPKGTQTAQTGINNYLKEYDPYDKRVDWATQPNEAGLTDEEIIKRSGGSASAAAKLADLRAMQRRQYLSDRGMTAASLLTGK